MMNYPTETINTIKQIKASFINHTFIIYLRRLPFAFIFENTNSSSDPTLSEVVIQLSSKDCDSAIFFDGVIIKRDHLIINASFYCP